MEINKISNFAPTMRGVIPKQKYIKLTTPVATTKKAYSLDLNKETGVIRITSDMPGAMDAICWYTLNKEGEATSQSCWQCTSIKAKSNKLKNLYNDILKETQNGTKELSQKRQQEILEQILKNMEKKKIKSPF